MIIKQYRANLTKMLLSSPSSKPFNKHQITTADFPPLPHPHNTSIYGYNRPMVEHNGIVSKLDQILDSMHNINNVIGDLNKRTDKIEDWLSNKKKFDSQMDNDMKAQKLNSVRLEGELKQQGKIIETIIMPILDDMMTLLLELNVKNGRTLNADFKSRCNVWKSELKAFLDKRLKI